MRVNKSRIEHTLEQFAQIGKTADGGVSRIAFSPLEKKANQLLADLLHNEGLIPRVGEMGNLFARKEGEIPSLPLVMFGSHLDTVPNGGRFDGALGVIAALEVVRVMNEQELSHRHPLEIVSFTCEESSRFGMGTLGSRAVAGILEIESFLNSKDKDGISARDAIARLGLKPENLASVKRDPKEIAAFIELHIEQGKILESLNKPIGIVSGIAKASRLVVSVYGSADHSGTTPMTLRKDALCAASAIVLAVERIVNTLGLPSSVATVGVLKIEPGAMNVVPGSATLGIDIRDIDYDKKREITEAIRQQILEISNQREMIMEIELIEDGKPIILSQEIIELTIASAKSCGIPYHLMHSGAGHDAMNLAQIIPTGMIFVPSREGKSHSPLEWTDIDQIVPGVELLLELILRLSA